ncbi:tubby-like protein 8 [Phalaenopsis equestris]|nr:tubby-like protein 8 [Phalaenopsis equestris]
MSAVKNPSSSSYDSLCLNPLMDKENIAPSHTSAAVGCFTSSKGKKHITAKSQQSNIALKPSSLQLFFRLNETETDSSLESSTPWEPLPSSSDVWDFSDKDAAPASSWSTLPNR